MTLHRKKMETMLKTAIESAGHDQAGIIIREG